MPGQRPPRAQGPSAPSFAHSAPEHGNTLLSKGTWHASALQDRSHSASPSIDIFKTSEGIFGQPHVKARAGLLQPTSPFLKAHMEQHPELWVSSGVGSAHTDNGIDGNGGSQEQQQSFMCLLQQ